MDIAAIIDAGLKLLGAIVIAGASAWITVYLSRNKFRSERWWEKKAQSYERVIEAFHDAKRFASEHLDALYKSESVDDCRSDELRILSKKAHDEIFRASDIGGFVLSDEALEVIADYLKEEGSAGEQESWHDYLEADWVRINKFMALFIAAAKSDLKGK